MTLRLALALISLLLSSAPRAVAAPTSAAATLRELRMVSPPPRDFAALRARVIPEQPSVGVARPPETFWVLNLLEKTYQAVPVRLTYSSTHADWYVQRGRDVDVSAAVEGFETRVFPRVTELTGADWRPGEAGQPRLALVHAVTPGVAGYMSSLDALPAEVFPHSNERRAIYLNLEALRPGTSGYLGTLAHELEHLAHFTLNPVQEGWLDEGLAELVSQLALESGAPGLTGFRAHPDIQLNAWSERPWEAKSHYEASYLWARYLVERGGGEQAIQDLTHAGGRGFDTINRFLTERGISGGVGGFFEDWLVANLLDEEQLGDGRYGYVGLSQRTVSPVPLSPGVVSQESVSQFAARYHQLPPGQQRVHVQISSETSLIGSPEQSSAFFWSLRGDSIDTRMTRLFNLGGVEHATLRYTAWYDLESGYDGCYVLASRDGTRWQALRTRLASDVNPLGLLVGPAYTGKSGDRPSWQEDEADLTPFVGGSVYARFECVTDQAYSGAGLAVDDLEVPEIGFRDDAEQDQGWVLEGFIRASNAVEQPASVLLVQRLASGTEVVDVPLDESGSGVVETGADSNWSVVIVSGQAPYILEPMRYTIQVDGPAP